MINEIKLASKFAHKDSSNAASNIYIKNKVIQCHDHVTGISLNVDSDIDFCCSALKLSAVLSKCDPEKLKITSKDGYIEVKSGRLKSKIKTINIDAYPVSDTDIDQSEIIGSPNIINDLKQLTVFTDPDDVRMFAQGVCITDKKIMATNGHVAVRKETLIETDKTLIIPSKSILKLAATKIDCDKFATKNKAVYLIFDGGILFAKTIDVGFPNIDAIITEINTPTNLADIADDLKTINSLCDIDKTVILGESIQTRDGSNKIDGHSLQECAFNSDYLIAISSIANEIDLSPFPKPCTFAGENIIGAVVGITI